MLSQFRVGGNGGGNWGRFGPRLDKRNEKCAFVVRRKGRSHRAIQLHFILFQSLSYLAFSKLKLPPASLLVREEIDGELNRGDGRHVCE